MAGVLAGCLLTARMTVMSLVKGNDVWYGGKGAAAPVLGAGARVGLCVAVCQSGALYLARHETRERDSLGWRQY